MIVCNFAGAHASHQELPDADIRLEAIVNAASALSQISGPASLLVC